MDVKNKSKEELLILIKEQEKVIRNIQIEENKYKSLFDNAINGIYKSTTDGKFVEVNASLVKMLGYSSREELLAIDIKSQLYFNVEDRQNVINDQLSNYINMYHVRKKDGTSIWVEDYVKSIKDASGKLLHYEGVIKDVSERKKSKTLLKIAEEGHKTRNLKEFNKFIKKELGVLIDTTNFYIAFLNEEKQTLSIPFIAGEESEEEFPIGKSMTGYLIKNKIPLLIKSEEYKKLIDTNEIELIGTFPKVWLGVPLRVNNKIIGAIVVQNYHDESAYQQADIGLLEFVASHISIAIQQNKEKEELQKLSMAVEQSANTIVITNVNGEIEYVNPKFTETSGYTFIEALGKNPRILNSGNQPKEVYADMWKTISKGDEWSGEFQNRSKKGKFYWERVVITPVKNDDGKVISYLAIKEDITKQKEIEHEVIVSKQVLRNVLDNIPIKVFWKDRNSNFLGCNASSLEEMNIEKEEDVIGKSDFDFHEKTDAEKYKADENSIMLSGKPQLNYTETQIRNNKTYTYITSKLPFFDKKNNVIGLVGTSEDVTIQKEIEEQLTIAIEESTAANLSKSIFLANMSHEIRTPMNAILGYSQLLQEDDNLTKIQHENINIINRSGEHLLALINDILDMSKIEAGRVILKLTDFNFYELIKEVEQLFKLKAREKNIELSLTVDNNIPKIINADESKIKQIMINLIGNALKFTADGFVRIHIVNTENNTLLFKVKDSGKGIMKDEHETVFKPFEQAQKGAHTEGGTGLGLAISKKLSNLMQGDIFVDSELGKGSEFSFTFKYNKGEGSLLKEHLAVLKVETLSPEMKGMKLAIVDDRFENRDILYKKLNPLGFDIRMAENGQEAVEIYKQWKPDIFLMDVVMPVLNGVEATRQILELAGDHKVKIFVVSASALESEQKEIMEIGATSFIKKPVKFDELLAEMHEKAGIKFLYKSNEKDNNKKAEGEPSDVPDEVKIKLLNAAEEGDFMLLQELLNVLEGSTGKTFITIDENINDMEFESIVNWLNS